MVRIPKARSTSKKPPQHIPSVTFEDGVDYVKRIIRGLGSPRPAPYQACRQGIVTACRVALEAIETHEQEGREFFRRLDEG